MVLAVSYPNNLFAQEVFSFEKVTEQGNIIVNLQIPEIYPHEIYDLKISFYNSTTNTLLPAGAILYDLDVIQNFLYIENYEDQIYDPNEYFEFLFDSGATGIAEVHVNVKKLYTDKDEILINELIIFQFEVLNPNKTILENSQISESKPIYDPGQTLREEALVMEQITLDGQVKVQLLWPEVEPDKIYGIYVNFLDPNTDELLENVEINFEIAVTQRGSFIESYGHLRTDKGNMHFVVMFPEDGKGPAEVVIEVVSITTDSGTIQIDEEFTFNVEVVPEFATLVIIVMAISFAGIITALRVKNKVGFPLKS